MSSQPKWIWYYGDYEIFHGNLLSDRREAYGLSYPSMSAYPSIHMNVEFVREYEFAEPTFFRVKANGRFRVEISGGMRPNESGEYVFPAGKHTLKICVCNRIGLPAVYVYGDKIVSDENWKVNAKDIKTVSAGCVPVYFSPDNDVEVFPFRYERVNYVHEKVLSDGKLYDFGKELFGYLYINGIDGEFDVFYGESEDEALDTENAIIMQKKVVGLNVKLVQRAFRYVYIRSRRSAREVYVEYEYLPLKDIGDFSCDDENVKKIFDMCAHTLRLNSRECYLDGIKRDRWVWAGDAYQSFMINPYLNFDKEIIKRTIVYLLGSLPYHRHINGINDYSLYLIISVYDYWFLTADTEFVRKVYEKVKALYDFCVQRLDENGFVCARPGDWIFIDWAKSLDKSGPHCVEQILLWQATRCIKRLAEICGEPCDGSADEANLREKIYEYFYDKEAGGFTDTFGSEHKTVNRHQNILALLYDFTSGEESALIMKKILLNDAIPQITTPYFRFFELMALCKNGRVDIAQDSISSYWGGMLELGATSVWELYDPLASGKEHYAMYGEPYGKSLCHAWGSGPICFLGKYVAGVKPVRAGYEEWQVCPMPGKYKNFRAVVPLKDGQVQVDYENGNLRILTDCDGGTLVWRGKNYLIEKNIPLCV